MNGMQSKFVKDAMDNEELLTEWEAGFIDNLAEYDENRALSDKENEILNRITQKINRW